MTAVSTSAAGTFRQWRLLLLIAAVLAVAVLVLVASRNLIARALARAWLKDQGVASALEVRGLSLTGLTARLKLGDPAAPDLTVDEMDVGYALNGPWNGRPLGVSTQSIRLVRPDVVAHWDGRRFTYGALTRLVEDFLRQPTNPANPPPRIVIEDGLAHLATPYGVVSVHGDALIDKVGLKDFQGRITPTRLSRGGVVLVTPGGPVSLERRGKTLEVEARLPVDEVRALGVAATNGRLMLSGNLPYAATGAVTLTADIAADSLSVGATAATHALLRWNFEGSGELGSAGGSVSGVGRLETHADSLIRANQRLGSISAALDLPQLSLAAGSGAFSAAGAGRGSATIDSVAAAGVRAEALSSRFDLGRFAFRSGRGGSWSAALASTTRAGRMLVSGFSLTDAKLDVAGQVRPDGADLSGAIAAAGAADPATARRFAKALAAVDEGYAAAFERAARRFTLQAPGLRLVSDGQAMALTAGRPIRVASASGAVLTLSARSAAPLARRTGGAAQGAFDARLDGGGLPHLEVDASDWRTADGVTLAHLDLRGAFDAGAVRGATLTASGAARLAVDGGSFTLSACAPLAANAVAVGANRLAAVSSRVCPTAEPLITTSGGGWRTAGRFEAAKASLSPAEVRLAGGAGRFDLSADARGALSGAVDLTSLTASDEATPLRFTPQTARGRLQLAGHQLTGRFVSATAGGRDLASVTLAHDLNSGAGHADIDSHGVAFAKTGLQPVALTPLIAFARDAEGPFAFTGRFDWTAKGLTSQGVLSSTGLTFKSPMGIVRDLKGDVRFTSLAPLVTAPDQTLSARAVEGVATLSDLTATFDISSTTLALDAAHGVTAKGRVSLEPMTLAIGDGANGATQGALVLNHVNLGELLAASSLADSVKVVMVVDGRLPFTVGPDGLHFLQGHITAVQPGRISIARAALTGMQTGGSGGSSGPAVNAVQDLAYEALENLAFDNLEADVASRPGGRLGMIFRIKGRYDPPTRRKAEFKISELLNGQAFQKKIPLPSDTPIDLNLDTSLNFDELITSLQQIWRRDTAQTRNSAVVQPTKP